MPIALRPIDLLAGIGPGITLDADDLPAGIADDQTSGASLTVEEAGRLVRDEPVVRRLIRTPGIGPGGGGRRSAPLVRRTRDKPSE